MARERRDNKGRLLLTGEAQIRNGSYTFRYTDENGVRKSITNWKLLPEDQPPKGDTNPECLRDMENRITDRRTKAMPKKTKTVNAFWQEYISMKCEIAETTLVRYIYLYNKHVKNEWGKRPIQSVRYSDVKQFYISRLKHGLSLSTLGNLNNVIHPVFELACREHYIAANPVDGVYQEFKKRKDWEPKYRDALTEEEQDRLLSYVAHTLDYRELLPVLTVFLGTGIRSGDDDDKIRLNQRKPSKYKGLSRFGPEKNLQRINKFMKERPTFYKKLIQMKENFRFYLRCFYCITKVVILQFNSEKQDRISS